jgi:uncharacterized protein YbjT (DUF2867 family)
VPDVAVTRATGYVGGQTARELAVAGIETLFLVPAAETRAGSSSIASPSLAALDALRVANDRA